MTTRRAGHLEARDAAHEALVDRVTKYSKIVMDRRSTSRVCAGCDRWVLLLDAFKAQGAPLYYHEACLPAGLVKTWDGYEELSQIKPQDGDSYDDAVAANEEPEG